ncbi:MAG: glycosyltransferase family 39 protein [Bacteroidales bacterium]|nr:glycosyltransferase family 39 protein [Bacteroidales bacterium]
MKERISELWQASPLKVIIWLAILTRLVAAIFSKGFGMHDDHFLVIEPAQSWVDGYDHDNWLPWNQPEDMNRAVNFFYVGIVYFILAFFKTIGITNPQLVMFFMRLIHGTWSLVTVYYGYKITEKLSDKKSAGTVGLLLAVLWFYPFVSVRNLVEIVCIPFLMYGLWLLVKFRDEKIPLKYLILSGFIMGVGFSVRYQTILFSFGVGLTLLIYRQWKDAIVFGISYLMAIAVFQGGIDLVMWGRPFQAIQSYINYNTEHALEYPVAPWYNYLLLIFGILIPPVSFFIFFGFLTTWKKHVLIFLPTLIFFAFHSYFPNKQERFILPVVPFIIMLGIIGWNRLVNTSTFWQKRKKFIKYSWVFFWVLNLILLPIISTTYSKRARTESMVYLSQYHDIKRIMLDSHRNYSMVMCPRSYLGGQWVNEYCITADLPREKLPDYVLADPNFQPRFILFFEEKELDKRIAAVREMYPHIVFEKKFHPGLIDRVLHRLNPMNANQTITIYRNTDFYPRGIDEK